MGTTKEDRSLGSCRPIPPRRGPTRRPAQCSSRGWAESDLLLLRWWSCSVSGWRVGRR